VGRGDDRKPELYFYLSSAFDQTHVSGDDGVNCACESGTKVELDVRGRVAVRWGDVAQREAEEELQQSTAMKVSGWRVRRCETRRGGARETAGTAKATKARVYKLRTGPREVEVETAEVRGECERWAGAMENAPKQGHGGRHSDRHRACHRLTGKRRRQRERHAWYHNRSLRCISGHLCKWEKRQRESKR
jgi:hypothetical protein